MHWGGRNRPANAVIVTITKFSIAIGSLRAHLLRKSAGHHVGVQLQVPSLNFFGI